MSSNRNDVSKARIRCCAAALLATALAACETTPPDAATSAAEPVIVSAPPPPPPPPPPVAAMAIPPRPESMIVVRGSDLALAFYPKGRKVAVGAEICLPAGDQYLTFQRSSGGTITYGGGGCNKLADDPTTPDDESAGAGSGP